MTGLHTRRNFSFSGKDEFAEAPIKGNSTLLPSSVAF